MLPSPAPLWIIAALCLGACTPKTEDIIHLKGKTMGTTYNIKYLPNTHSPPPSQVQKKVDTLLEQLNEKLSTWRPKSEISRFNDHPPGKWFSVGSQLYTVAAHALTIAEQTAGAFDPTLGPLINLWGFGPRGDKRVPSARKKLPRPGSGLDTVN